MIIENIKIGRIIIHEVVRATQLEEERPPLLNEKLIKLDTQSKELIEQRLTSTLGSGSHCVDVEVEDNTPESSFDRVTRLLDTNDVDFIKISKILAQDLSRAQTTGSISSGSVFFVEGTAVIDKRGEEHRFIAVIKADSDKALHKEISNENINLEYIKDMILGESQRLLKVALFAEKPVSNLNKKSIINQRQPNEFEIKIFDHLMRNSGNSTAAKYFYKTFLGCKLARTASLETKTFFDTARDVITGSSLSQDEKMELSFSLITQFKNNNTTLEPRTFAQEILPEELQDPFIQECSNSGINNAISKDTSLLKPQFRRQSIKFTSDVTIYAPPDELHNSVILESSDDGWTQLKIRGTVKEIS